MKILILFATISWIHAGEGTLPIKAENLKKNEFKGTVSHKDDYPMFKLLITDMRKAYDECEADGILNEAAYVCYTVTKYADNVLELEHFNLILATFLYKEEDDTVSSNRMPLYCKIFDKFIKSDAMAVNTSKKVDIKSVLEASKAFASGIFLKTIFKYKARYCSAIIKRVEMSPKLFEAYLEGVQIAFDDQFIKNNSQIVRNFDPDDINNEQRMERVLSNIFVSMFWQPFPEGRNLSIYDAELIKNSALLPKWEGFFDFETIQKNVAARAAVLCYLLLGL